MVTWPPSRRILALPIGSDEVVELGHVEALAVEHLVLEEHDRVGIADRGLEQALGVGGAVGGHDLEARAVRVPAAVFLAVLGADAGGGAVGAAEHDRAAQLAAGHVERLGGRVDDVVDRLHGEVPGHELDDRPQARHRGADAEAGEAVLGDRRVDHPLGAELLEQALADLVGALVLGDLLAHQEHVGVAAHLLGHGVAQRLAHGLADHLGAGRDLGLARRLDAAWAGRSVSAVAGFFSPVGVGVGLAAGLAAAAGDGRTRVVQGARVLAVAQQHGDRRVHRHALGAGRDQDLAQRALVDRLDLHRRLVGLDLGDHVAGPDRVALALEPLGEVALGHGRRQSRHQNRGRHRCLPAGAAAGSPVAVAA